jgi:hypothetical protein
MRNHETISQVDGARSHTGAFIIPRAIDHDGVDERVCEHRRARRSLAGS